MAVVEMALDMKLPEAGKLAQTIFWTTLKHKISFSLPFDSIRIYFYHLSFHFDTQVLNNLVEKVEKHEEICVKTSQKKRKAFDMTKARVKVIFHQFQI